MSGLRLAEVGRPGLDPVHPELGGDVEPESGRMLSVAELRDVIKAVRQRHATNPLVRLAGAAARGDEPGLPVVELAPAPVFVVGVSGGCGESTLAAVLPGAVATHRHWPRVLDEDGAAVVLVARSTMASLIAAQQVAAQWAADEIPRGVKLLGLIVVADAPGAEPRPVAELVQLLAGGVPRVWRLPWVREWRLHRPGLKGLPRAVRPVTDEITALYLTPPGSQPAGSARERRR
jgi:hypothetical protein